MVYAAGKKPGEVAVKQCCKSETPGDTDDTNLKI